MLKSFVNSLIQFLVLLLCLQFTIIFIADPSVDYFFTIIVEIVKDADHRSPELKMMSSNVQIIFYSIYCQTKHKQATNYHIGAAGT